MGFKLGVKTEGDTNWVSNALCFATEKEAEEYGKDLFSRWMAMKETKVLPSDEPINYQFVDGKSKRISE